MCLRLCRGGWCGRLVGYMFLVLLRDADGRSRSLAWHFVGVGCVWGGRVTLRLRKCEMGGSK